MEKNPVTEEKPAKNTEEKDLRTVAEEERLIEKIVARTKNMALAEWNEVITFVRKPWRLLVVNFMIGLLRGIGFFLGMTIVGAAELAGFLSLAKPMINKLLHIPGLSSWLAQLIQEIQKNLSKFQGG